MLYNTKNVKKKNKKKNMQTQNTPTNPENPPQNAEIQKPSCPYCQGEIIYPELKEDQPPEPPRCKNCKKFIPPPECPPFFKFFRHHGHKNRHQKCVNCGKEYPQLELKPGEIPVMPKCSSCGTVMNPPNYLPKCKNCGNLYPIPNYKKGETPIMPKCSSCGTEMDLPGPKCQKCGEPIPRLTKEEREERKKLYWSGKNPEPRKCKKCGEILQKPFRKHYGRRHEKNDSHGKHDRHHHKHHHRWGMNPWFKYGGKNYRKENDVYNYYGYKYFGPYQNDYGSNHGNMEQNNNIPNEGVIKNENQEEFNELQNYYGYNYDYYGNQNQDGNNEINDQEYENNPMPFYDPYYGYSNEFNTPNEQPKK